MKTSAGPELNEFNDDALLLGYLNALKARPELSQDEVGIVTRLLALQSWKKIQGTLAPEEVPIYEEAIQALAVHGIYPED